MKGLVVLLVASLVAGCSTVKYRNVTTGDEFSYTRIGASKIGALTAEPTEGGGIAVTLEGFESDGSSQALEVMSTALVEQARLGAQ